MIARFGPLPEARLLRPPLGQPLALAPGSHAQLARADCFAHSAARLARGYGLLRTPSLRGFA